VRRTEDQVIAYTWSHFINDTSQPDWLLRLPMTKAVVRAMDTIQAIAKTVPGVPHVESFVVGGASKRGWTAWTTAIVDKRVIAITPIVIPILNLLPNLNHHYQVYGGWSFAFDHYNDFHITKFLNTPVFLEMAKIIDPFSYLDRLTMPKFIACATGDEFFPPDSPQFFLDKLPGENHLRYMPNSEHSMSGHATDLAAEIVTFYSMVIKNQTRPTISYANTFYPNGSALLTVKARTQPSRVRVWHADTLSHTLRDFRLVICDDIAKCAQIVPWFPKELNATVVGDTFVYSAYIEKPANGWRGYMIQVDNRIAVPTDEFVFTQTTQVYVTPDVLPFPPCQDHC